MSQASNSIILQAANAFGTPLYIYDTSIIQNQYNKLKKAFSKSPTKIFYACKALSNINILRYIKSLGACLDCVSIQEVELGLHAGFEAHEILFTPNCVDFEEIQQAKALNVHINIDNISMLERFGNTYGSSYPICIRINPHIMAGGNYKISTGHIDSKFGISIHQLRHIERIIDSTGLVVNGLHMHTGSEIKDMQTFIMGLDVMIELSRHFKDLKYIDLGSGFKVPYSDDEVETDVQALGKIIKEAFEALLAESGRALEIWFEPGKYLVSEAGQLIVKANVIKQTTATVFVGVNSGFNHLIRPMFYEAYHKIENISNPEGTDRIYTVVGNICETDTFAWDRKLKEVREGDYLAIKNAGAYGFEMSSRFNSRYRPAEVLVHNDSLHLIRSRDTFTDLISNQIDVL